MDKQSLVLYFMSLLFMTTALKIRDILVPPTVNLSSDEPIILDCDYDLENDSSADLVIKWFHNDQNIYQWIINHEPQDVGPFRGKLDLSYRASTNELTQYRAIKIKEPFREMAGIYKCVVFNFRHEDQMSKRMIVIQKPSKLQMLQLESDDDDDSISVACSAFDVYPEPNLNISSSSSSEFDNVVNDLEKTEDGLFNVTQIVTLKEEMLENITDFICELTIPDTDYIIEKTLTFVPGSVTTEPEPESDYNNAPVSQSPYIEDNASALAPVWMLLLVAAMTTLLST